MNYRLSIIAVLLIQSAYGASFDTSPIGPRKVLRIGYDSMAPMTSGPNAILEISGKFCSGNSGQVSVMKDKNSLLIQLRPMSCDSSIHFADIDGKPFSPNEFVIHLSSAKQVTMIKELLTGNGHAQLSITDQSCFRKPGNSPHCNVDSSIVTLVGPNGEKKNIPAYSKENIQVDTPDESVAAPMQDYFVNHRASISSTRAALISELQQISDFTSSPKKTPAGALQTSQIYKPDLTTDGGAEPQVIIGDKSGTPQ
jgi:hypothetical protein